MTWTNLSQVIKQIHSQTGWQQRNQFVQILEQWKDVVGESVAKQSQPVGVYRGVLQVAVSSSVWAQVLTFERRRILEKLNPRLANTPLQDIHFSTAKWNSTLTTRKEQEKVRSQISEELKQHPSYIIATSTQATQKQDYPLKSPPQDAVEAFQRWAKLMKSNNSQLPLCNRCRRPAPPGEIARWQMCRNCANTYYFSD